MIPQWRFQCLHLEKTSKTMKIFTTVKKDWMMAYRLVCEYQCSWKRSKCTWKWTNEWQELRFYFNCMWCSKIKLCVKGQEFKAKNGCSSEQAVGGCVCKLMEQGGNEVCIICVFLSSSYSTSFSHWWKRNNYDEDI